MASQSARIVLGCYRNGDAADPEIYVRAVAAVLSAYPEKVVQRVADPRTGIAGQSKWLPTIAEMKHACEVEMAPTYAAARRENSRLQLLALQDHGDRSRRKTYAELKAAYPDILGKERQPGEIVGGCDDPSTVERRLREKFANLPITVSDRLIAQNAARALGVLDRAEKSN
jgi:hypothetical protein